MAPVSGPAGARITVTLDNIPLGEALRYVANQAGLKVKVEPYAIAVVPLTEQSNELITKRYHVPPEFFGGPLDVGYYIGSQVAGGQSTQGGNTQVAPVAETEIEKEAVSFQTAAGVGTGAGQEWDCSIPRDGVPDATIPNNPLVGAFAGKPFQKSAGRSRKPIVASVENTRTDRFCAAW